MADSRYNVDDILREVRAKKEKAATAVPFDTAAPAVQPPKAEPKPAPKAEPQAEIKVIPKEAPPKPAEQPRTEVVKPKEAAAPAAKPVEAAPAPKAEPIPEIRWDVQPEEPPKDAIRVHAAAKKQTAWSTEQAREAVEPTLEELERRHRRLLVTLVLNLVALGGVIYFALAPVYHLMLPGILATSSAYRMWAMVALTAISALACGGTLGNGFLALFPGRRSNDAYVTLTVFACLLQGSFMAASPELLQEFGDNVYLPLAAAILLFNTCGRLVQNSRQRRSCEAVATLPPVACRMMEKGRLAEWAKSLPEQPETVLSFSPAAGMLGLEEALTDTSSAENLSGIVAPVSALAALAMAVVGYFLDGGNIFQSVCIFTAALCITSPLAAALGSALPLGSANRALSRRKADILNTDTAEDLAEADAVLLRCSDLFPAGNITLHGIRTFDKKPIDEAILNAASVLCCVDNTLTAIFRGMIASQDILKPVEGIVSEEGMGLSAWVDGGRVLIGNRALLQTHGVQVPPEEIEQRFAAEGKELLYLSNFGSLSAGFVISYRADKQVKRQLLELERAGVALLLQSTDPNVTPARVAQVYGVKESSIHAVPAKLLAEAQAALEPCEVTEAGLLSGSVAGSLHSLLSAQRCCGIDRAISVMLVLSVLIGFALITFLAYSGVTERLTWPAMMIYHLLWLLPIVLLGLSRKK